MDCRSALAKLYEYIDGEIGDVERDAIAAHVTACRPCFDQFETERLFQEFVARRTPRPEARAEFKTHLLARLREESRGDAIARPQRISMIPALARFAVAASLLLGVALGAGWLDAKTGPQRVAWRTLAGYHHGRIPVDEIGIETSDYAQAREFLAAQMGPALASLLPQDLPQGVTAHESCVEPWKDCRLGHLEMDAGSSGPISLFVIPADAFRFRDEARIQIADRSYRSVKLGCCRAVCWQTESDYVFVLLGDCGANDLLAYAEAWNGMKGQPRNSIRDFDSVYSYSSPRR